jgi:hypothetical protein
MPLDALCGQDHPSPLPTGAAIGRREVVHRGTGAVPLGAGAHRGKGLRRWLAAWIVALLASAPFARSPIPLELAGAPAAADALVGQLDAEGKQPAAGLRPDQPLALGILSRLSLLETKLGLPPVKPPLLRPAVDQPVLAWAATTARGHDLRGVFHRSSVGTARTPTGPPS